MQLRFDPCSSAHHLETRDDARHHSIEKKHREPNICNVNNGIDLLRPTSSPVSGTMFGHVRWLRPYGAAHNLFHPTLGHQHVIEIRRGKIRVHQRIVLEMRDDTRHHSIEKKHREPNICNVNNGIDLLRPTSSPVSGTMFGHVRWLRPYGAAHNLFHPTLGHQHVIEIRRGKIRVHQRIVLETRDDAKLRSIEKAHGKHLQRVGNNSLDILRPTSSPASGTMFGFHGTKKTRSYSSQLVMD